VTIDNIEKKQLNPGHIVRSFNRSDGRADIHLHLCTIYPKGESMEEISEVTGYTERDVCGILLGDGNRYKPEDSLVTMGLATKEIEDLHGKKVMIFRAMSNGEDVDNLLRGYARKNNPLTKLKEYVKKLEGK